MSVAQWWAKWVLGLTATAALGLAGWGLKEIVTLKDRTGRVEARTTIIEGRQDRGDLALSDAIKKMADMEAAGTPGFKIHDLLDQQRDMELRTRISRVEVALEKLTTLTEKWAVAATDIAWIKTELQARKITETTKAQTP